MSTQKALVEGARRAKRQWTEVEYLLLLVVILVTGWLIRDLIQMIGSDKLPVKLAGGMERMRGSLRVLASPSILVTWPPSTFLRISWRRSLRDFGWLVRSLSSWAC